MLVSVVRKQTISYKEWFALSINKSNRNNDNKSQECIGKELVSHYFLACSSVLGFIVCVCVTVVSNYGGQSENRNRKSSGEDSRS